MGHKKRHGAKAKANFSGQSHAAGDPHQITLFIIITIAYVACVGLLTLMIGVTASTFLATPIWAFLFLLFSRSNRSVGDGVVNWFRAIQIPKPDIPTVGFSALAIFLIQFTAGFLLAEYMSNTDPDFFESVPDNTLGALDVLSTNFTTALVLLLSIVLSYVAAGYVAGFILHEKNGRPYFHAALGTAAYNFVAFSIALPLLMLSDNPEDAPTKLDIVFILLFTGPTYLLAALGTRIAVGPRKEAKPVKVETEGAWPKKLLTVTRLLRNRRVFTSLTALLVLTTGGILVWRHYKAHRVTRCQSPPLTAMLNPWPVTYAGIAELCHDLPALDARLVDSQNYSQSREEWERGLATQIGNEFYVLIYINNGAADNAEEINPGRGIARSVRLTTEVPVDDANFHYIKTSFGGTNTNTVVSQFKITTDPHGRLEVIPRSGEIYNYVGTELIAGNLDVGNNTIDIGDLTPKWQASRFIRFRVKVVQ